MVGNGFMIFRDRWCRVGGIVTATPLSQKVLVWPSIGIPIIRSLYCRALFISVAIILRATNSDPKAVLRESFQWCFGTLLNTKWLEPPEKNNDTCSGSSCNIIIGIRCIKKEGCPWWAGALGGMASIVPIMVYSADVWPVTFEGIKCNFRSDMFLIVGKNMD